MTYENYRLLHRKGKVFCPRSIEFNILPSATDPTQDMPMSQVELLANGMPVNVNVVNLPMTGVKIEEMTSIDRRLRDKFDVFGEFQTISENAHNIIKKSKKI